MPRKACSFQATCPAPTARAVASGAHVEEGRVGLPGPEVPTPASIREYIYSTSSAPGMFQASAEVVSRMSDPRQLKCFSSLGGVCCVREPVVGSESCLVTYKVI